MILPAKLKLNLFTSLHFYRPLAGPSHHLSTSHERKEAWLQLWSLAGAQLGLLAPNLRAFSTVYVHSGVLWSLWEGVWGYMSLCLPF